MKFTVTTPDIGRIKNELRRVIGKLKTEDFVTVGIHEDTGDHQGADMTNATLGALLHFGSGNIPPRPWLNLGVESGIEEYLNLIEDGITDDLPPTQILEQVGVVAVGKTKEFMTDLRSPPNAPETIRLKKSDNPLIDTGALRASIDYKLTGVKPEEGLQ